MLDSNSSVIQQVQCAFVLFGWVLMLKRAEHTKMTFKESKEGKVQRNF
jgi:hypothetical protein